MVLKAMKRAAPGAANSAAAEASPDSDDQGGSSDRQPGRSTRSRLRGRTGRRGRSDQPRGRHETSSGQDAPADQAQQNAPADKSTRPASQSSHQEDLATVPRSPAPLVGHPALNLLHYGPKRAGAAPAPAPAAIANSQAQLLQHLHELQRLQQLHLADTQALRTSPLMAHAEVMRLQQQAQLMQMHLQRVNQHLAQPPASEASLASLQPSNAQDMALLNELFRSAGTTATPWIPPYDLMELGDLSDLNDQFSLSSVVPGNE